MTVSAVSRRVAYTGNGITTSFSVPFQFFEIEVYLAGSLLADGVDYEVVQTSLGASGSITTAVAPTSPDILVIVGATAEVQDTDLVDNDSAPAETYEAALDRLTMIAQEATLATEQSIRAPRFAAPLPEIDFAANPRTFLYVGVDGVPILEDPDTLLVGLPTELIDQATEAAQNAIDASAAASSTADAAVASIEAAVADFNLLYLGPKSTAPTLNNSGGALVVGNLYFNTVAGVIAIWDGAAWVTAFTPGASGVSTFNGRTGSVSPGSSDYSATQIANTPAGSIASTTVQAALNELDTEKATTGSVAAVASDLSTLSTTVGTKLASSSYTAADVLAKVKTVDGAASGLDADLLDGLDSAVFSKVTRTWNAPTGSTYTFVLADDGKLIGTNNAAANTYTIPPNSLVAFPVGTQIDVVQIGAGQTTISPGAGVTLSSYTSKVKLAGQFASATLVKYATDTWVLTGNLA